MVNIKSVSPETEMKTMKNTLKASAGAFVVGICAMSLIVGERGSPLPYMIPMAWAGMIAGAIMTIIAVSKSR